LDFGWCLEADVVVIVRFENWEPVDNEFFGLAVGESEFGEFFFEEFGRVGAFYNKTVSC